MTLIAKVSWLALAGAVGTLARFGLISLAESIIQKEYPWGTLAVNLVGCLLVGLLLGLAEGRLKIEPQTLTLLLIGFFGAFTTFSAFVLETIQLLKGSGWLLALRNIALHNLLGVATLFGGLKLGQIL